MAEETRISPRGDERRNEAHISNTSTEEKKLLGSSIVGSHPVFMYCVQGGYEVLVGVCSS